LACRLRSITGDPISESQNAFVDRQQILGVVLMANELYKFQAKEAEDAL